MGGGKPIVSEDMRGTLTSSDSYFVHMSTFIIFLCKSCTIVISEYSRLSHLENYVRVVVVEFDLQRVSFHDVIDFLSHNIMTKLLSLYTHESILFESQNFVAMLRRHYQSQICCEMQVHARSSRQFVLSIEAIARLD